MGASESTAAGEGTPLTAKARRENNWPVCRPFLRHDIAGDILDPTQRQLCYYLYFSWYALIALLIYGIACTGAYMVQNDHSTTGIITFVMAWVWAALWVPSAFRTYRMFYNDARQRSTTFLVFKCFFIIQMLFEVLFALGIPHVGSGGIIIAIKSAHQKTTAVLNAFATVFWSLLILFHLFILVKVRLHERDIEAALDRGEAPTYSYDSKSSAAAAAAQPETRSSLPPPPPQAAEAYGARKSDYLAQPPAATAAAAANAPQWGASNPMYPAQQQQTTGNVGAHLAGHDPNSFQGAAANYAAQTAWNNKEQVAQTAWDNRQAAASTVVNNSGAISDGVARAAQHY